MSSDTAFPPLSFVLLKGFGEKAIPVQVAVDSRFLVLSTYYCLSPVVAISPLIESSLGSQAEIINISKNNYIELLLKVKTMEESAEESEQRIKTNDPLLIVRAFMHLVNQYNLKTKPDSVISDEDMAMAIKQSVKDDDLIKDAHQNIVNVLKKTVQI